MKCYKCGRIIMEDARFCSYCGVDQEKEDRGKLIFVIFLIPVALFVMFFLVQNMLGKEVIPSISGKQSESQAVETDVAADQAVDKKAEDAEETEISIDPHIAAIFDSTIYGAVYQNGYLVYGPIKMELPGFILEEDDDESLVSENGECLVYVNKVKETGVSYEKSSEEGMLQSFNQDSEAGKEPYSMEKYKKFYAGQYPVILSCVHCSTDGMNTIEAIILDQEQATQSARIKLYSVDYGEFEDMIPYFEKMQENETPVEETGKNGITKISSGAGYITKDGVFMTDVVKCKTTGRYNIRKTPNGEVFDTLEEGQVCLKISEGEGDDADWVEIQLENGTSGWVAATGITVIEANEDEAK